MRILLILTTITLLAAACTKCVECDIKLKEGFLHVATIDEFCGTSDDVEEEEQRLADEHSCIVCTVNTTLGPTSSGFLCGDRAFTDSVNDTWRNGAFAGGYSHQCVYYRDTLEVVCTLIPE